MVSQHAPVLPGGPVGGLLAGQVVGARFTCLGPLAQDLLGPIYRAQRSDGTPCTLQVLQVQPDSRASIRRELERELRAAAALRHPSLGGPVEVFTDEHGVTYLIREAMPGETLE